MSEDVPFRDIGPTHIGKSRQTEFPRRKSRWLSAVSVSVPANSPLWVCCLQVADDVAVVGAAAGAVISAYALGVVVGAPLIAVLAARFAPLSCAAGPDGGLCVGQFRVRICSKLPPLVRGALFSRACPRRLFRRGGTGGGRTCGTEPAGARGRAGHEWA